VDVLSPWVSRGWLAQLLGLQSTDSLNFWNSVFVVRSLFAVLESH
jgi:hypothetical protein